MKKSHEIAPPSPASTSGDITIRNTVKEILAEEKS